MLMSDDCNRDMADLAFSRVIIRVDRAFYEMMLRRQSSSSQLKDRLYLH